MNGDELSSVLCFASKLTDRYEIETGPALLLCACFWGQEKLQLVAPGLIEQPRLYLALPAVGSAGTE